MAERALGSLDLTYEGLKPTCTCIIRTIRSVWILPMRD